MRKTLVFSLIALLFQTVSIRADSSTEYGVKAGFVYNFAKFVEWPDRVFAFTAAPLRLCILGQSPLDGKLELLAQRQAQGHPIEITENPLAQDWPNCQMLYLGADQASQLSALQATLAQAPVLTISDIPDFTEKGGMIELYIEEGRVRFAINLAIAQQADLKLSAQMLRMAKIVE
ncbi:MAG: YfiR family protein [Candidatus Competibacteraceae bacterium]|nr:YfiR family protein [Candidatus Competibacteraceae bacterium]